MMNGFAGIPIFIILHFLSLLPLCASAVQNETHLSVSTVPSVFQNFSPTLSAKHPPA
jgi:hypothetical protein